MAKILQNNYFTMKLSTEQIKNMNGGQYTFKEAVENSDIITSGDCLVFQKVLEYNGIVDDHVKLFKRVEQLRNEQKEYRKNKTKENAKDTKKQIDKIQSELNRLLYIDDIISVQVLSKKDYSYIARHGFDINGKHYVRFMAGSGNLRRNTVIFINAELFEFMTEHLMCGLNGKIKRINLAKLGAYFALSMSSVLWVRKPRVCVMKDFYTIIPNQDINYMDENDKVSRIKKDIELNSCDGQGLIDPSMAINWAGDMHLDYTPSSFVVRSCWVKGNLVPFNFRQYAMEHGITTITDRWGQEFNIMEVDVILSESQFKMHKYYSSWETYESFHNEYNLKWGVARYNKEHDAEYVKTNYQYLQVLDLDDSGVDDLLEYTINWINNICKGELLNTLAYVIGVNDEGIDRNELLNKCSSVFTKAIMKNSLFLDDSYVQKKIYNSIKEAIREAKMGRVWVRGNYQFMISDPVAQCRAALGLSPEGLLPANHVYSKFWNDRQVTGEIIGCRSPLTTYSEVVVNELANTQDMQKWYQYINSGFIQSIYDINVMLEADGDYDGDIIFSTNNEQFLKGVRRGELPIIYDKENVPTQRITLPNQIKCDNRALNTIVGQITNYGTSMYAMLPMFKGEDYIELDRRIKMTRKLQGEEIDKAKGTTPPNIPKEWLKNKKVNKNDSDEVKIAKYKHNAFVISQKPYFFIYLYQNLMKEYKQYKKGFETLSIKQYNQKLSTLLTKGSDKRTDSETNFIRRYRKYSPVLETNCVMNNVCKKIENVDNDIKWKKSSKNVLIDFVDFSNIDKKLVDKTYKLVKLYNSRKGVRGLEVLADYEGINNDDVYELFNNKTYAHKDSVRNNILELYDTTKDMFNHIMFMASAYNVKTETVWELMGDDIIDCIPWGSSYIVTRDESGCDYLGCKLSIKEVD